ncbi:MAG: phosphoribosylglycinamide formyltransferase [Hyphomicrobiaceae bacterium]|nr:phosphoribosylglycinamide formyltransferase [Hyphomicrobiaceae bacterium]
MSGETCSPARPVVPRARVGVLISGRGSNMMALVEAARAADYPATIALVVSNRPDAAGLAWAASEGIATVALDHKAFATREDFDKAVDAALVAAGVDIVACAGFMRLMTPWLVQRWMNRMINIHPALLPSFKGLDTHARALAAGVMIAGCTVHVVREAMDEGPILGQAAVPVLADDTPLTLAERVLSAEHRLYPAVLALFARDAFAIVADTARLTVQTPVNPAAMLLSPGEATADVVGQKR